MRLDAAAAHRSADLIAVDGARAPEPGFSRERRLGVEGGGGTQLDGRPQGTAG